MKSVRFVALAALVLVIAGGLWYYWRHTSLFPSTQDAYVRANIVTMASQVSGEITAVKVSENQRVAAGDVLVELDASIFENAITAAKAQVESASEAESAFAAQISAASAAVESAQAALDAAIAQFDRVQTLFDKGDAAQAALDQARAARAQSQSALNGAQAQLAQARSALVSNRDALTTAQAQLATATVNLNHTKIVAPTDAWVANISLREGTTISAYQPLFSLVEATEWWVDANFKETDMVRLAVGQPVAVTIDMLPGQQIQGEVASLGIGSGATFALLPAENASGNWVKVTQRFPVRIRLDHGSLQLRAGASATVTVDTTQAQPQSGSQ